MVQNVVFGKLVPKPSLMGGLPLKSVLTSSNVIENKSLLLQIGDAVVYVYN